MRTTLTIDDDLAGILQRKARQEGASFKEVVIAALRKGVAERLEPQQNRAVVRPHDFGASPGLDYDRLNKFVEESEALDYLRKVAKDGPD